jgi:hypothetical protein
MRAPLHHQLDDLENTGVNVHRKRFRLCADVVTIDYWLFKGRKYSPNQDKSGPTKSRSINTFRQLAASDLRP